MTKPSAILITKTERLEDLPENERAVVRKFLFGGIQGLNDQHEKRWRRFWGRIQRAEVGEVFDLQIVVARSGQFHRRHMAIEQLLFDRQEQWDDIKKFRAWLKTGAAWGHFEIVKNRMKFVPSSLSYEDCSDDEMREVHESMVAFLRRPATQKRIWPHLSADQRHEMLENIIDPPEQAQ